MTEPYASGAPAQAGTGSTARPPAPAPDKLVPNARWMFGDPARFIAMGFGSGLGKPAPGTWGTLFGWLSWVVWLQPLSTAMQALALLTALVVGVLACQRAGRQLGEPDAGVFVIDEIVAIWLVLWLVPAHWSNQLVAVLVFRVFDILKPQPIRWMDRRWKNGAGVMLDDLVAAFYTLLLIALIKRLFG